ncbi:MAG: TonB-dependent receptor [Mediterranea sp.]|nr:TonB-dependent receptor [Mediterranea sp.]
MKVLTLTGMLCAGASAWGQSAPKDSLQYVALEEVEIVSTRATQKTPVTFTNMGKEQIGKQNFGQDIPFLLALTPSVTTTSDAGSGIGYTGIRVRGTDASRINVTANGIPMNDAESLSVFWVNTPDLASSLEDMQIQRGAGTSTNGAGAFGASINMRTQGIPSKAYAEAAGSYGSFRTHKETVKVGTGLIGNQWTFDARISNVRSEGYRDRAASDMKSYFLQGGWYGGKTSVKLITFGGKEETYHAWDGISKADLKTNRRYNPNGKIEDSDGNTIGFYNGQTDNYRQTHYQLIVNHAFSQAWSMNAALHYTNGFGYYEEYKNRRTLVEYRLEPYTYNGTVYKKSDLVRRKLVGSDFGGGVFSITYKDGRLETVAGGGLNRYVSSHYGRVIWIKNYIGSLAPDHEYYRNSGRKTDGNLYAKATYDLGGGVNLYADAQYRYVSYKINGVNDKWDWTAAPEGLQKLNVDENFGFFNPKAGLFWQINPHHSAYASFGIAQKEPSRNNYTDGLFTQFSKPEKLLDHELGYTYRSERFTAGVNLYYMDYTDQLVLNGKLNEIGEAMAENVKDSYRMGVELTAGAKLTPWLRWDANATWSKNRIKNYVEYISDESWSGPQYENRLGTTPIAFSPSLTAGSQIGIEHKGWQAAFQSQYVSRQYIDNSGSKENALDAYFVNHLHASYTFAAPCLKSITAGVAIYNIFNQMYQTNGYAQKTYKPGTDGNASPIITNDPRFYPMAGAHVLFNITVKF